MKNTLSKILPLAIALARGASIFAADESAPASTRTTPAAARQVDENRLSPASVKLVRLLQSGMDEKVIVAYVKNNPTPKAVSAEELVYLHELGVTTPVLTAMLTPAKKAETAHAPVPEATEKVEVTSNYTPIPGAPQPAPVNGSAVISTPAPAPAPVIVQPAQPTVVYTQPAPVIVESAPPVYYDNRPTFSFGFGLGHHGLFGSHHGGGHHAGGHYGGYSGGHHGGGSRHGGHH